MCACEEMGSGERLLLCPSHTAAWRNLQRRKIPLTPTQHLVLGYIKEFETRVGWVPSYQEIADGLGYSSLATVHEHVHTLAGKHHVRLHEGQRRTIQVLP